MVPFWPCRTGRVAGEGRGGRQCRHCDGGPLPSDQGRRGSSEPLPITFLRTLLLLATGEATPSSWSL